MDSEKGDYYLYAHEHADPFICPKETFDCAQLSDNRVAALQMYRIGGLSGDLTLEGKIEQMFPSASNEIEQCSAGHA